MNNPKTLQYIGCVLLFLVFTFNAIQLKGLQVSLEYFIISLISQVIACQTILLSNFSEFTQVSLLIARYLCMCAKAVSTTTS